MTESVDSLNRHHNLCAALPLSTLSIRVLSVLARQLLRSHRASNIVVMSREGVVLLRIRR